MKKLIINLFLLLFLSFIILIITLSTIGIETNKFNKIISDKVYQTKNINLDLNTIKFKLDPKQLSLFLETKNPKITFRDVLIPVQNIKIYVDFLSLLKSNPIIKKTNLSLEELDIVQLNKLSKIIKPSNFKSLINNKIKEGKLVSEIEIFLNDQGTLKNFIAKGKVKDLKAELFNGLHLLNTNLTFFADRNDILIKNIFGEIEDIKISDGDLKLNLENGIKLNSNFNTVLDLDENKLNKYLQFLNKNIFAKNIKLFSGNFNNILSIDLDKTYKVKDFNYSISGELKKSKLTLNNLIENNFIQEDIKEIFLSDLQMKTSFSPKKNSLNIDGKYSFDNSNFLNINLKREADKEAVNLKLDFDFKNGFDLDLINYKKSPGSIANLSLNLNKKDDFYIVSRLNYIENKNSIKITNLRFKNKKFLSFKNIEVFTTNNDFIIEKDKKIIIKGKKFDATKLSKFINKQSDQNKLENINGDIEIDFKDIKIPMSEKLKNFMLIGEINKGQFIKISAKGDFGGNNFLDISMKKDKNSNKKYLEIYSDLTRPLLTDYNFFDGLSGGKLLFSSVIDDEKSESKLKIEDFKVINAPGVIKLLSLADLRGLADLAEGEGLTFDVLEIDMEKTKDLLTLKEILALGPSMSVLMEGYQSKEGLTSLRGTLVPAKTLNKLISKIPVIGNIIIPKEIGEGLFGISFKMKGPKGKIKTTINPIRTLTPRFIQKIIDRNKETK